MPLLELTLTQLWNKQTNAKLTHNIYEEIGGVKKSIANHAKEVYEQLNDEKRKKLEQIFIQLINLENLKAYTLRVKNYTNLGEDNWELITYLNSENISLVIINYNLRKILRDNGSNLSEPNLEEDKFNSAHAPKAQFQVADISKADLSNANLDGTNFSRAKLNEVNFSKAYMPNVNC